MLDGHVTDCPVNCPVADLSGAGEPTVGEIVDRGLFIRVTCACGHEREMSPKLICVGRNVTVSKLASLITCSRCRQKGLDARVSGKPIAI